MQRQEVRTREHLVEGAALDTELPEALGADERVVRDDLHLQAERASGDLAADPAKAEHAERLVGELDAAPFRALPPALDERGVRLRDVARERDEQADRVLGGRDDVRLGRIRDDDPLARRRVDVDVVDPHSGAADHAQSRGACDHIGRHLRRGADDQRLVAVDDLVERRLGVDDDVESLAQQVDARVRDLLADEHPRPRHHQAATLLSNASNARGTAAPRSMSAPSSLSESSTAASALAMSKTSNQPMCPMRKIFPLRWPWPGASVTP